MGWLDVPATGVQQPCAELRQIALRLALEIIYSINLDRQPNPETIHKLEAVTSPGPTNLSLDVWVCGAIQGASAKKKARTRIKL